MIGRLTTAAGAAAVVATSGVEQGAMVATSGPTMWFFLGYPFEAAGMIAALFGCLMARFWIGAAQSLRKQHRWALDAPVSGMVMALSAAVVIWQHPAPFGGLLYGAGLGVIGEGVFKFAEKYLRRMIPELTGDDPAPAPTAP